ncbi:alpha/beta hydrolase [Deinococcus sp. QL22]|uniref:alpha/beta hydrolase n=1 Tax=Deinococcus sp. QL22 TaxID=2939437 RepID=UPI002017D99C|nr:alpha/beta hydrolase [Deinococcus sp. QL22]UQN09159.1 alpha/beta hydrolase [Deinococcus sp. QL22]
MNSTLPPQAAFELPLWPQGATTTIQGTRVERWFSTPPGASFFFNQVRNVSEPTLTGFLPDSLVTTGTAVVICPGGGHHTLAIEHEGYDVARWLTARGIAAFVLKYRTVPTPDLDEAFEAQFQERLQQPEVLQALMREHTPHVLADGQRALDLVREHANEWGVAADRVGMMGFSAGAHVTVCVTLNSDKGSRPDFAAPIYGALWEEVRVGEDVPPLFLAYANDDDLGEWVVGPTLKLYAAWRAVGRPAELHVYAQGGHGFGLRQQGLPSDGWINRFYDWLQAQRWVEGCPYP